VFDSGEDDGVPFLVMERLPGRTLADELTDGPLSPERARAVVREVLSALGAAHAAGIIHRDIKPGNVLLTEDGHVKVSDFGIAKTVDDLDQTQTAELVATPGYLAPERLVGEAASHRSDLYSVGVMLYEALSGRRPFERDTPLAVMRAIEQGEAEPLISLRPELSPDVVAVVERAMSVDPNDRFESAVEMAAALEATPVLEPTPDPDATVPIEFAGAPETVPVNVEARAGDTRVLPRPSPAGVASDTGAPARRGPRRLIAIGISAAVAGALVAGVVTSRRDSGRSAFPPPRTTGPAPVTAPAPTRLPAPLDGALRGLEQTVSK
jgi:serine/threonine-protein kinase